ncbi:UNVERIFIED_CONTAM: hypothetical protein Sindi_1683700 [Sesamum indicum]
MATMATSSSFSSILSPHTQPVRELNRHSYLTLYFTKNRKPINCESSARQPLYPIVTSSSLSGTSFSVANETVPMVPPYNVLITGSSKDILYRSEPRYNLWSIIYCYKLQYLVLVPEADSGFFRCLHEERAS